MNDMQQIAEDTIIKYILHPAMVAVGKAHGLDEKAATYFANYACTENPKLTMEFIEKVKFSPEFSELREKIKSMDKSQCIVSSGEFAGKEIEQWMLSDADVQEIIEKSINSCG